MGSSASFYLAAAGVGKLGLVDSDCVTRNNLNRQIVHHQGSLGQPKVISAKNTLQKLNPYLDYVLYNEEFTPENGLRIAENYDLIVDATDNVDAKFVINEVCATLKKPNIYGVANTYEGRVSVFNYQNGPCLACLFSKGFSDPDAFVAVLGTVPGLIGTLQANEAIKIILGFDEILSGRLLIFNAKESSFKELTILKNEACPICHHETRRV